MCGIAGILEVAPHASAEEMRFTVRRMADALSPRGPDDQGEWVDAQAGVALGHRRLAILDLSPNGHQPMESHSGRYVLIFGGEIYNFEDLRKQLDFVRWRGHSDTEVMLAAFDAWGVGEAVRRFNGMFSFALWDRRERLLHLGRDRFGEKPLYYGWMGASFLFGSELSALRAHPAFQARLDREAVWLYLRFSCVPAPHSIYEGIRKLPPGCTLTLRAHSQTHDEPIPYWTLQAIVEEARRSPLDITPTEARQALDGLLRDAVRMRLASDVPLGALLSGGIDSSTVVALMQAQGTRPVRTFTIGFRELMYDEAPYARRVAEVLGTDHTEMYVTPREALEVIPMLPRLYAEPFADSSQIPTYLVSRLARQHVTVSLSGDGGDELFGGYLRHLWAPRIWTLIGWLPHIFRRAVARFLLALSPARWNAIGAPFLRPTRPFVLGEKVHKIATVLEVADTPALYVRLVSAWNNPTCVLPGINEPSTALPYPVELSSLMSVAERMMYRDAVTYLPDDILAKVDRASMAVGLEVRTPYLDHRVAEFAWRLPQSYRIRNATQKWLLRQVLHTYVPRALMERPKTGFGIPLGAWLRGALRSWAEALLDADVLRDRGLLEPAPIRQCWNEHLSGIRDWSVALWPVLMLGAWLETGR